ncbi:MAG: hypothetical protein K6C94_07805 [Candidatus Gastranaerophilales bacterium]|nr:hypothetical protein [Candidatus Gastranaerophilales bacterium]
MAALLERDCHVGQNNFTSLAMTTDVITRSISDEVIPETKKDCHVGQNNFTSLAMTLVW